MNTLEVTRYPSSSFVYVTPISFRLENERHLWYLLIGTSTSSLKLISNAGIARWGQWSTNQVLMNFVSWFKLYSFCCILWFWFNWLCYLLIAVAVGWIIVGWCLLSTLVLTSATTIVKRWAGCWFDSFYSLLMEYHSSLHLKNAIIKQFNMVGRKQRTRRSLAFVLRQFKTLFLSVLYCFFDIVITDTAKTKLPPYIPRAFRWLFQSLQ